MTDDKIIQTDHPLSEDQKSVLDALLNLIIPSSGDGRMPGAAEMDFLGYLVGDESGFLPKLVQVLNAIVDAADSSHGKSFTEINESDQLDLVNSLRSSKGELFNRLTNQVMACYYQNDRVMRGLGLEPRPPFPKGNQVDEGDLSLLEPVRQRGEIWRKV
jgi:hypothetical protein